MFLNSVIFPPVIKNQNVETQMFWNKVTNVRWKLPNLQMYKTCYHIIVLAYLFYAAPTIAI